MTFYNDKLRIELSTIDDNIKMEISSEDGINHVHIIPLKDYLDLLRMINLFNNQFYDDRNNKLN
jgi:hypothetical protein